MRVLDNTGATMVPDVTIIMPQRNHSELTCAALATLRHHESQIWPVIVVDDGSEPESRAQVLSRGFKNVHVISQHSKGVTAAWNRGVRDATTPYILFLNNDVLFDGPVMERLIASLKDGQAALSGIRFRSESMLPQTILRKLPTQRFLEGWCFAAARETVEAVGGFDEAMTLYWSDTDFQARVALKHVGGAEPLVSCPGLPLRHLGHRTAHRLPNRQRQWQSDRAAFIAKWSSPECSISCRSAMSVASSAARPPVPGP